MTYLIILANGDGSPTPNCYRPQACFIIKQGSRVVQITKKAIFGGPEAIQARLALSTTSHPPGSQA